MKKSGLRFISVKKYRPGKQIKTHIQECENPLIQGFTTIALNQKWVTDITYIHTKQDGWTYLSTIQDLHSKKIIGWKIGKQMTKELVLETLDQALLNHRLTKDLIIHSGSGFQYTSDSYKNKLKELEIKHSFSQKDCPYDNAGMESFHVALKKKKFIQQKFMKVLKSLV